LNKLISLMGKKNKKQTVKVNANDPDSLKNRGNEEFQK